MRKARGLDRAAPRRAAPGPPSPPRAALGPESPLTPADARIRSQSKGHTPEPAAPRRAGAGQPHPAGASHPKNMLKISSGSISSDP
jgi:hypothetical protein